jgi:DNA primase
MALAVKPVLTLYVFIMRFDPRFLEQIKNRIAVSALVGRSVPLRKAGREYRGMSPFNKEKTASFFVNDAKQAWFDFSSGKSGDIFTWLIEFQGLAFPEAVERLAAEAGLDMPVETPEARERRKVEAAVSDWLEEAQTFFHSQLLGPGGVTARAYLTERRRLPASEWARYEIGYAPDGWTTLYDHLTRKGAKPAALKEAGLIVTRDDPSRPFDYFRHRITFAIRDGRDRLIGFGARALKPDDPAKYINSPDTALFHKGHALYRYNEARASLHERHHTERPKGLIVVEGYFDAIALARAGLGHGVAPLGTALTEEQLALLWRAGEEALLSFDGDKAGRRAAFRALDRALPLLGDSKALRFAFLPDGQDPDDLLREAGPQALSDALDQTYGVADVLWEREILAHDVATPEGRAAMKRSYTKALAAMGDRDLAQQYRLMLDERFDDQFGFAARRRASRAGTREDGKWEGGRPQRPGATSLPSPRQSARRLFTINLVAMLIERPELIEPCCELLALLIFDDGDAESVRQALVRLALSGVPIDNATLTRQFDNLGISDTATTLRKLATITLPTTDRQAAIEHWQTEARAYLGLRDHRTLMDSRKREALEGLLEGNRERVRAVLLQDGADATAVEDSSLSDRDADAAAMERAKALANAAIDRKKHSRSRK